MMITSSPGIALSARSSRNKLVFALVHPIFAHSRVISNMKSVVALSLLAAGATAFAPQQQLASSKTALKAFENEIGATPINGEMVCWDPCGFVTDQASFDKFRALELKHGRIAMLAFLGYATTWNTDFRFPGCADFPGGHKAVFAIDNFDLLFPILCVCGFLETQVFIQKEGSFPGDMGGAKDYPVGFGPVLTKGYDETEIRTKELLNGRAAMMGWLTLLVHEQIDGKPFIFFDHFDAYYPGPLAI